MTTPKTPQPETQANGALSMACQKAQAYADAARAKTTRTVYAGAWRRWAQWCAEMHTMPLPAAPETVAAYLAELARAGCSVATVKAALAAIAAQHSDSGQPLDGAHAALGSVKAGIARLNARPVRRARALGLEELARIAETLQGGDIRALRDRALLLVGFFGALRRSELVALDVEGASFVEIAEAGLLIHVTGGKTSAVTQTIGVCRRSDALCPAAAVADYLAATRLTSGPLFRAVSRGGRLLERRLDAGSLRHILRTRAAAAFSGDDAAAPHAPAQSPLAALRADHCGCGAWRARARHPGEQPACVAGGAAHLHSPRGCLPRRRRHLPRVNAQICARFAAFRGAIQAANPHIACMGDHIDILALAAACARLGIDIDTLPRDLRAPVADDGAAARPQDTPLALTDREWAILAPLLPPEPPQAETLSNRAVLDRVIWVIAKGRRWTELDAAHEAVRRKFGRWAHAGIWQQLHAAAAVGSALDAGRLAHLKRIANRAESLSGKRRRPRG